MFHWRKYAPTNRIIFISQKSLIHKHHKNKINLRVIKHLTNYLKCRMIVIKKNHYKILKNVQDQKKVRKFGNDIKKVMNFF